MATSKLDISKGIRAAYHGRFTQTEIAHRLGVTQHTISRWSTGAALPTLEDLVAFEDACERPRGYVLRAAGILPLDITVEGALAADPLLDDVSRSVLLAGLRAARQGVRGRRPSSPGGSSVTPGTHRPS